MPEQEILEFCDGGRRVAAMGIDIGKIELRVREVGCIPALGVFEQRDRGIVVV